MTPLDKEREEAERAAFEAWFCVGGASKPPRRIDGEYLNPQTNILWDCWLARASLAAEASPLTDDLITDGDYPAIHEPRTGACCPECMLKAEHICGAFTPFDPNPSICGRYLPDGTKCLHYAACHGE
jgi:hypothetical protein